MYKEIIDFAHHVAGSAQVIAVNLFDYCARDVAQDKNSLQAVIVIHNFTPRIMSYVKVITGRTIVIMAVDQWVFERDIERGFLGEASVSTLMFPYIALVGEKYLHAQEIMLKKRLILELLENLSISFPELSDKLHIKPEYFMFEVLLNRVRVFPPLAECVSNFMQDTKTRNKPNPTLDGYMQALAILEKEAKVKMSDNYIMIPKKLVPDNKKPKVWLTNIFKNAPRTLFTPIFEFFPQFLNLFNQNPEMLLKFQTFEQLKRTYDEKRAFEDPERYISVPTLHGLVPLTDKINITDFVKEKVLHAKKAKIKLERAGGVLNDVYLITAKSDSEEKQVILKRFKDWSGFKWFPLNLWSLGTRQFAVLGKSRLEKECVISEILHSKNFNVPRVLHVSVNERLIFMEYIKGKDLTHNIKRIGRIKSQDAISKDLKLLTRVGELLAEVHALNVVLGDTKPENVIVNCDNRLYLLDFEQASEGGDKSWDIAEFLYFSGHYLPPLGSAEKAELIANAFISGYLKAGGSLSSVKKAGDAKYTRIFGVFTAPAVLTAMSAACKKAEKLK
ncbi:MAG: AarF/UbiB family protein [Chloroflexota bacterium]